MISSGDISKVIGIIFDFAGDILRPEKVLNFLNKSSILVILSVFCYSTIMRPSSEYEIDVSKSI